MSDDEDNLFDDGAESDDTNDLIESTKASTTAANKKKRAPPKKGGGGGGGGLFDSDSDSDDGDTKPKKKMANSKKKKGSSGGGDDDDKKAPLSKRERMNALAKQRKKADDDDIGGGGSNKSRRGDGSHSNTKNKKESGYDSGDSYASEEYQRTKEDDDFLDTTGEDQDAVNELYAEQTFHDERGHSDDEDGGRRRRKGGGGYSSYGKKKRGRSEAAEAMAGADDNDPIKQVMEKMKRKKRVKKQVAEIEPEIQEFLSKMTIAAEDDEQAIAERRPALKKLQMLNTVIDMITNLDMQQHLLENDLLSYVKRWIQPLPNGTLGNVTVRQKLIESVSKIQKVEPVHLKNSGIGKVVMLLHNHKSETPTMKRILKNLIEQWSRSIFDKSANLTKLKECASQRGVRHGGVAALSKQQHIVDKYNEAQTQRQLSESRKQDLDSLITTGRKDSAMGGSGNNRVRVPYSQGFNFTIQPEGRVSSNDGTPDRQQQRRGGGGPDGGGGDVRSNLSKRILEKGRTVTKNQRSANISVEGRPTK